jgi:signal transduction histidine kinase
MEYGIIRGLCWYRIVAAFWAVGVVAVTYKKLAYPNLAVTTVCALVIIAFFIQSISRRDPSILMRPEIVVSELLFSVALTLLGGYVYDRGSSSATLALAAHYILPSVLMAGVSFGLIGGIAGGCILGIARVGASAINRTDIFHSSQALSLLSTTFTLAIAGGLMGGVVTILRRAGGELSDSRARDNIARTLHDGVLQTLVIIQRRSNEDDVIELASQSEQDLRSFLFTHQSALSDSVVTLHNGLESVVEQFSKKSSVPVSIVIAPDIGEFSRSVIKAVSGAVSECLNNVAKHSEATSVSIYAEPDDSTAVISIRDNGKGFDVAAISAEEKHGIRSSIVARVEDVGGSVTIHSTENGTDVQLRVPSEQVRVK